MNEYGNIGCLRCNKRKYLLLLSLGGFSPPGGLDFRIGYNPRGGFPPPGPVGGMYPIRPLPPLVDVPYGPGPALGARYPTPALLTSTRVSSSNIDSGILSHIHLFR